MMVTDRLERWLNFFGDVMVMIFFLSDAILMFLDTHHRQEDQDSLACKAILLSFQDICGWRERTEDSPESLGRFNIKMDQIEI